MTCEVLYIVNQIMYKKYYLRSIHVNTYIRNEDFPHQCSICGQPHILFKYLKRKKEKKRLIVLGISSMGLNILNNQEGIRIIGKSSLGSQQPCHDLSLPHKYVSKNFFIPDLGLMSESSDSTNQVIIHVSLRFPDNSQKVIVAQPHRLESKGTIRGISQIWVQIKQERVVIKVNFGQMSNICFRERRFLVRVSPNSIKSTLDETL